jgi:hypothetical protein
MKHYLGLALLAWGAAGIVNQMFYIKALTSGQAPTAMLNSVDPATVLNIANPGGAGYTSPGMLTDTAIAAVGAWLVWG